MGSSDDIARYGSAGPSGRHCYRSTEAESHGHGRVTLDTHAETVASAPQQTAAERKRRIVRLPPTTSAPLPTVVPPRVEFASPVPVDRSPEQEPVMFESESEWLDKLYGMMLAWADQMSGRRGASLGRTITARKRR